MRLDGLVAGVRHWAAGLEEVHRRIAGGFSRAELRAGVVCLRGLLGQCERRNGWTLAEAAGEVCPGRDAAAAADHALERRRGPRRA